jgi:hypothetical protein
LKPVMTKVAAERAKIAKVDPKIAAKAKLEKDNPARYWVQIATGKASALGFDYRKFVKKYPELLKTEIRSRRNGARQIGFWLVLLRTRKRRRRGRATIKRVAVMLSCGKARLARPLVR